MKLTVVLTTVFAAMAIALPAIEQRTPEAGLEVANEGPVMAPRDVIEQRRGLTRAQLQAAVAAATAKLADTVAKLSAARTDLLSNPSLANLSKYSAALAANAAAVTALASAKTALSGYVGP